MSHMHIGGVTLVEGPPPTMEEFLGEIRMRLHLVPRYRQKLAYTVLDSGRPVWIDDPSFNLEYHIRHTALPASGAVTLRVQGGAGRTIVALPESRCVHVRTIVDHRRWTRAQLGEVELDDVVRPGALARGRRELRDAVANRLSAGRGIGKEPG